MKNLYYAVFNSMTEKQTIVERECEQCRGRKKVNHE